MNRTEKQQTVDQLRDVFTQNSGVFLFGFSGISVPDITELRREISKGGSSYRVVKNRLAIRAAQETAAEALADQFRGPTALAYSESDPVGLAKTVKAFVKNHPGIEFKAGVLDNKTTLNAEEVEQLADMPSREELLSKLLYLLNAPVTRLASALNSPLVNLGSVLKQLEEAKQKGE